MSLILLFASLSAVMARTPPYRRSASSTWASSSSPPFPIKNGHAVRNADPMPYPSAWGNDFSNSFLASRDASRFIQDDSTFSDIKARANCKKGVCIGPNGQAHLQKTQPPPKLPKCMAPGPNGIGCDDPKPAHKPKSTT
ncbi:hypothetical protein MMC10_004973 [Thelotrema lepadinum]|nr:hypothetical protein [Thelotrema lepadinum]